MPPAPPAPPAPSPSAGQALGPQRRLPLPLHSAAYRGRPLPGRETAAGPPPTCAAPRGPEQSGRVSPAHGGPAAPKHHRREARADAAESQQSSLPSLKSDVHGMSTKTPSD